MRAIARGKNSRMTNRFYHRWLMNRINMMRMKRTKRIRMKRMKRANRIKMTMIRMMRRISWAMGVRNMIMLCGPT
jgi:hypothetical protein